MMNQVSLSNFEELRTFVAIADAGSLAGAAVSLGLQPNAVSRRLSALEERLGRRLMNRTTRRLSLTDEGARFRERCRRVLVELHEAEQELLGGGEGEGTLRVAVHGDLVSPHVLEGIRNFLAEKPRLRLQFRVASRFVDPIKEGLDVVTHVGKLKDSSLVAVPLGETVWALAASPAYLSRHKTPKSPHELKTHECLRLLGDAPETHWRLSRKSERPKHFEIGGRFETNDGGGLQMALYAGVGIGIRLLPEIEAAQRAGTLERVLPDWRWAATPAYAMLPSGRLKLPVVRSFVELLKASISRLQ